jgi:hypothetical protein
MKQDSVDNSGVGFLVVIGVTLLSCGVGFISEAAYGFFLAGFAFLFMAFLAWK